MTSRKKAKGKARKAANAQKQAEKDEAAAKPKPKEEAEGDVMALEVQMQRLMISTQKCPHGYTPLRLRDGSGSDCLDFAVEFMTKAQNNIHQRNPFLEAALETWEKYLHVWKDPAKMKSAVSYFLSSGTQHYLNGKKKEAGFNAALAYTLEQHIAVALHETQYAINYAKLYELSDEHTLVSFFRNRISCNCLDKKHKAVKSTPKMGICSNAQCSLPGRKIERNKMLHCTGCRLVYYCSPACRAQQWPTHKAFCNKQAAERAKFDSKQKS